MHIRIDALGTTQVSRRLIGMGNRIADARPVWPVVTDYLRQRTEDQFKTRGSAFNTPWAPLKPATIAAKRRAGYAEPEQPLVATGATRTALTKPGRPRGSLRRTKKDELRFGTTIGRAFIHQKGNSAGRPPKRTIISLQEMDKRKIVKAIQFYGARGVIQPI